MTQTGEPKDGDCSIRDLIEPHRIGAHLKPPIAEHQEERSFVLVARMSPAAVAQPGLEIIKDAAPVVEMPLHRDQWEEQQIKGERGRRGNNPARHDIASDQKMHAKKANTQTVRRRTRIFLEIDRCHFHAISSLGCPGRP